MSQLVIAIPLRGCEAYLPGQVGLRRWTMFAQRRALLETVRDKYGDVARWSSTLGKAARGELFELEHLQIGMVAPDIQGDDLDGVDFKLSEYRCKVVFLDFWGDW